MKKIKQRAMALLLAVIVFFSGIIYQPVDVQAAWIPAAEHVFVHVVLPLLGGYVVNKGLDIVWDKYVAKDKEGNYVITPEALEELKQDYMKEVESAAAQIPGAYVRHQEIDLTTVPPAGSDMYLFAVANKGRPGMYGTRMPYFDTYHNCQPLPAGFYVAGTNGKISTYNSNLVLVSPETHQFTDRYNGFNKTDFPEGYGGCGTLYGGDIVVFESAKALDTYLGQFREDPSSVPMYPYTQETVGGTDKEIKVWDPETNVDMSIFDVDLDLSRGLVITPDGKIYLNYQDANGNGIADDHDPDIKDSASTVLWSDTENGWGSGTVELADVWSNYAFLGITYGSPADGGYHGGTSSVFYVATDELMETGTCFVPHYDKRYMQIGIVSDNYKKLNMIRIGATGESDAHAPVVYVIRGYKASSGSGGGSSGGGSPDMSETNEELRGIRGVLDDILKWCKKIYNQVVVGNVIDAIDAIANVLDTLKDYLAKVVGDAAAIAELGDELVTKFPFSLPQDILLVVTLFEAEPVAPVWEIPFRADFGGPTGTKIDETFTIDFTDFKDAVDVLKWFLSLVWIFGLAMLTPKVLGIGGIGNSKGD